MGSLFHLFVLTRIVYPAFIAIYASTLYYNLRHIMPGKPFNLQNKFQYN